PWSQPGTFLDTTSNPLVKSDKYKISLVNLDGIESEKSPYHKTIHLNINPGLYGYNLIWNHYEGFEFLSYHIWRKIGNASFELIAGVASNVDSYTDFYTASGLSTYYIEVVRPEPCVPSVKSLEFASVISNPGTAAPLGIEEQEGAIILYPNPVQDKLEIVKNGIGIGPLNAKVFRVNGQIIRQLQLVDNRSEIDLNDFTPGVYFIRISGENFTMVRKIIKE
ncbi:MAG: T9SS type A sorting domain-containing protein, partial [Bacteroidota bacterium]